MRTIYRNILEYVQTDAPLVLATVTRATGSTPQKPGSSALFDHGGLLAGTVGGGLVEGEISQIARWSLDRKASGHYHFRLDEDQGEEGALCGGMISVLVDSSPGDHREIFNSMHQSLTGQLPGGIVTLVFPKNGDEVYIRRYWITETQTDHLPAEIDDLIRESMVKRIRSGKAGKILEYEVGKPGEKAEVLVFFEPVFPLPQLIIAGAGHIGKALAHFGHLLDFEVTVIDDRPEYASPENIPEADHIIVDEIGKAMSELVLKQYSYIVIVTRGHEHDAEALRSCLGREVAYTGMIGSANKVATMKKRFLSRGWATREQWEAIHTPIGLPIGSKTVQEIAVSIAAQLIRVRADKNSGYG